jgi:hypothetical protein
MIDKVYCRRIYSFFHDTMRMQPVCGWDLSRGNDAPHDGATHHYIRPEIKVSLEAHDLRFKARPA